MTDTVVVLDKRVEKKPKRKFERPKDVQILLRVCSCFGDFSLDAYKVNRISQILRISERDLISCVTQAVKTRKPQVVGCYTPEIAETILIRLTAQTPFILPSCHKFFSEKM